MPTAKELGRPIRVLLVEDSRSDALLVREGLKRANIDHTLDHVEDGVEAMQFLQREGPYSGVPRPDVVLLDLNLPRKNGHEVLAEMTANDALRRLPVMVWTTSEDKPDCDAGSAPLVIRCVTKPAGMEGFIEVMQALRSLALTGVSPPSKD